MSINRQYYTRIREYKKSKHNNNNIPSFILPSNPNTFPTAGRTKNMVELPVIPNTVHNNIISPYHFIVFLGGMGLGPKNRCRKLCSDCLVGLGLGVPPSLLTLAVVSLPFLPPLLLLLFHLLVQHLLEPDNSCKLLFRLLLLVMLIILFLVQHRENNVSCCFNALFDKDNDDAITDEDTDTDADLLADSIILVVDSILLILLIDFG